MTFREKLPVLLLAACGPSAPILYTTPCGLKVESMVYEGHHEALPAVAAAAELAGIHAGLFSCEDLSKAPIRVQFRSQVAWKDSGGSGVAGQTFCQDSFNPDVLVVTGNARETPIYQTAFVHELVHAARECPWENYTHDGWKPDIANRVNAANEELKNGRL